MFFSSFFRFITEDVKKSVKKLTEILAYNP